MSNKREQTIIQQHKKNFETLTKAFENNNVCLMECTETATGEKVAVICASYVDEEGMYNFVPFARFFNGNPYEILTPPIQPED